MGSPVIRPLRSKDLMDEILKWKSPTVTYDSSINLYNKVGMFPADVQVHNL